MKKEFLQELGIPEEAIPKIMDENGKDIQNIEKKLNTATSERDTLKASLDDVQNQLKAFDGVDVKDLQSKIATLTTDLADKDKTYQEQLTEMKRHSETKEFFGSYGKKFINKETAVYYEDAINKALQDPANANKNRKDIFEELIKGEDGSLRTDIFHVENAIDNKTLPPAGITMTQGAKPLTGSKFF